ncbi:MAG: DUF1223 domain-containing protein [Maricaulaceae bacterium]
MAFRFFDLYTTFMKATLLISAGIALFASVALYMSNTSTGEGSATSLVPVAFSQIVGDHEKFPTEVVELFTSQGCSSCPPADRFIASLADSPSVLPLTFNVTYWDYLGWKDRFGQREFTSRQKSYAKVFGAGNVYTPQIILNGAQHSNKFTREQIKSKRLTDSRPLIDLKFEGQSLRAQSLSGADISAYDLTVVSFSPGLQATPVKRGENRNRTLENYNVVTGVYNLTQDEGFSLNMPGHKAGMAYALLASSPDTAEILSVTRILPK